MVRSETYLKIWDKKENESLFLYVCGHVGQRRRKTCMFMLSGTEMGDDKT